MLKQIVIPIGWTIVLGTLCGLPGNTFPNLSFWKLLQFDSAAHTFVFMTFTFLWGVGLSKQASFPAIKKYAVYIACTGGILYGILIEIMQYYVFIGRSFEYADMLADAIGCLTGLLVFRWVYKPVLFQKQA